MNDPEEPPCPTPATDDTGSPATPEKKRVILVGVGPRLLNIAAFAQLGATPVKLIESPTPLPKEMLSGLTLSKTSPGGIRKLGSGIVTGAGSPDPNETIVPLPREASEPYTPSGVRGRLQRAAWRLRHPNWRAAMAVPPPEHQGFMLHENQPIEFAGMTVTGRLRGHTPNLAAEFPGRPTDSRLFRYSMASIEYREFLRYGYGPAALAAFDELARMGKEMDVSCEKLRDLMKKFLEFGVSDRQLGEMKYRRRYLRRGLRMRRGKPTRR